MRLVYLAGTPLPSDRESVYWLNVLEIPPKPTAGSAENYLQFAIKTRLKIFYRPKGLPGTADAAPTQLKWTVTPAAGGSFGVQVENPTPFYVSFAELRLVTSAGPVGETINGMVPPQGRLPLTFKAPAGAPFAPVKVQFKTVNDYGAFIDGTADLR
jgi:chaperone protein EcpD